MSFQLFWYFSWRAPVVSGPCAVFQKGSRVSFHLSARPDRSVTEESLWAVRSAHCHHRSPRQKWVLFLDCAFMETQWGPCLWTTHWNQGWKSSLTDFIMAYNSDWSISKAFMCYPSSSALSILWLDSKRAIHLVPKRSCRAGNEEVQKKPRDSQVESPIEWSSHPQCASRPLLAFRYFLLLFPIQTIL